MKKCMLIAFLTIFALWAFGAPCFARTVANTTKKGSLLIFPLIKIGPKASQDTIITLTNDYNLKVKGQCIYKIPKSCDCVPFDFSLTANQSISFTVKKGVGVDGLPIPRVGGNTVQVKAFDTYGSNVGELKCWAVNGAKEPISFNWLSGNAIIGEDDNESWEYSAWRFAVGIDVVNNFKVPNAVVNGVGTLRLTGTPTTYDACPQRLIFNFVEQAQNPAAVPFPIGDSGGYRTVDNRLTLIPCKQDCVTDNNTIVRADLAVNNEYETSSGTYACFDCSDNDTAFFSKSLSGVDPGSAHQQINDPSVFRLLQSPGGMITVDTKLVGDGANCQGSIGASATHGIPVLGVMSMKFSSANGPVAGETPTVLGPPQALITDATGGNTTTEVAITYRP